MRKALRIMAILAAFGLTAWIGVVALAQSSPTQAPTTTTVGTGDEFKGNCDEAEHVNDPECVGATLVAEDNDEQGDNNDDQGENEDGDHNGADLNDDQGDNNDDQGENEGNDDQGQSESSDDQGENDDHQGDNDNQGEDDNSGPSNNSGNGGGDDQGEDD